MIGQRDHVGVDKSSPSTAIQGDSAIRDHFRSLGWFDEVLAQAACAVLPSTRNFCDLISKNEKYEKIFVKRQIVKIAVNKVYVDESKKINNSLFWLNNQPIGGSIRLLG